MANKSKSILDEAYDEARALEEALKANAKDLLSATMKTDLESLVKESLEDDDEIEDAGDVEVDTDDKTSDVDIDDEGNEDEDGDDEGGEDLGIDDLDDTTDELPAVGDDSEIDTDMDDVDTDIEPMDTETDVVDMTAASDGEVLKVFKQMGPEDGIVVTKDTEGNIDVNTGTEEFKIITSEPSMEEEEGISDLDIDNDSDEGDEVMYELNLDGLDEEMYEDKDDPFDSKVSVNKTNPMNDVKGGEYKNAPYTGKNSVDTDAPFTTKDKVQPVSECGDTEAEMHENKPRVMSNRFRTTSNNQNAGPYTNGKRQTRGALQQEELVHYQKLVESLKAENKNFKKAVEDFKKKLHEVALFNSNLAYAVRLFTEQTTTKKEKINILRRFDNVKNLEESKRLFESIQKELGSIIIKESKNVDEKITKTQTSGASQETTNKPKTQIFESKIYEDPKFKRSLDIMKKINK